MGTAAARALNGSRARRRLVALHGERREGRVLVLGAGFLGSHAVNRLVQDGFRVDVVTRSEPRTELGHLLAGATVALGDVTATSTLAALVAEADHIVYAVGSSSPVESNLDPASDVSLVVTPVVRLLELLRLRPSVSLTYLSSGGTIYGNVDADLVDEDTRPEPISSYGIAKLTAEHYLASYARLYGVPVRILRISNAYGPGQPWAKGQGLVARLIHCASTGNPFSVYGDGSNVRDYVYVEDVAGVISAMVSKVEPFLVLNVGSGVGHSVMDVLRMVEEVSEQQILVEYFDHRAFDVGRIVLDVSRMSQHLDYRPVPLRAGILSTWESSFDQDVASPSMSDLLRLPQLAT
jgi:UDP-glucose 4-epimerase